jgi:hypothetical protein
LSLTITTLVNQLKFKDIPKLAKALKLKFAHAKHWSEQNQTPDTRRYRAAWSDFTTTVSGGDVGCLMAVFLAGPKSTDILQQVKDKINVSHHTLLNNLREHLQHCEGNQSPPIMLIRRTVLHALVGP